MTPVAGDRALEMAARFLGIRFNQLERRPAPFTHCDLFASPNRGSLNVDQSCYNLGVEPSVRNKNLPGDALVAEVTPDRVRHALGHLTYVTYGSKPDVAARVWVLASWVTRFANSYVAALNALISEMRMSSNEVKFTLRRDLHKAEAHLVLFADGAMGASGPQKKATEDELDRCSPSRVECRMARFVAPPGRGDNLGEWRNHLSRLRSSQLQALLSLQYLSARCVLTLLAAIFS